MLTQRHRAYFTAVMLLQRMLRRAIRGYQLRKDEREAAPSSSGTA